jgi:toxin ParE1/3/4
MDLEEIVSYIAADSPINAKNVLAKLRGQAESLEVTPLRGRVVPELAQFGIRTWRELFVKPYRIIYRIAEKRVYLLAVLDGRRDLEDVLLERLLRIT